MKNREVFLKDPAANRLVNNGVAEVAEPQTAHELLTLRHELETFVCEGQYAKGLDRILNGYLSNLDREEQPAVWVSGFYGSGKSHFVKMLRYLWVDFAFDDGATARGLTHLPTEVEDALKELSTQGKRLGILHAAAGTLGSGAGDSVRLALLGIVFRSAGLPSDYASARFVLFLKKNGFLDTVRKEVEKDGKSFEKELPNLYVSPVLAKALLTVDPAFAGSEKEVRPLIKEQFPRPSDITDAEMRHAIEEALTSDGKLPCTLIVLDEVQQYIDVYSDRAYRVQELAQACSKHFGSRILFVGTGQTAITGTPQLQKLQARFTVPVELSDADVDTVIRKIVLAKKPDKQPAIEEKISICSGEISRHLVGTKLESRNEDRKFLVADYPLLPVRRRFWERAMRAVDPTGTKAQLRNQLMNVYEAVRATAEESLGTVVAADFIYDQNKTQMVQTGALLREIQEIIERLNDGSGDGRLKSRLCALCFLIGKFPRDPGADQGVRAKPDVLADLLVEDLTAGSAELRKRIPTLLEELVQAGHLMQVENEYRLQTRESSEWQGDYNNRRDRILNDEATLASERADLLRARCGEALKSVKLSHGTSKLQRKIDVHFTQDQPPVDGPNIPIWVRDGWNEDEKSVLTDVRAAGTESPLVTIYIPRRSADDLKRHLASAKAARETLNAKGVPSTREGLEARTAMDTRKAGTESNLNTLLEEILDGARVYLAGGSEKTGTSLAEAVKDAADDALIRLYPRFGDADDPRWGKVVERAKNGAPDALAAVDYQGDPEKHKVCGAILGYVAGGKKGREIRKFFGNPRYGWPQDAIDGALLVLVGSGHLRATQDSGKELTQKQLDQSKIGVVNFRLETTTVTVQQRMAVRKLFQDAGIAVKPNEEGKSAQLYLQEIKRLSAAAGGDPPLPGRPSTQELDELTGLTGNEQLVALYEAREELASQAEAWRRAGKLAEKRLPRWRALEQLQREARGLPVAAEVVPQIDALRTNRALLNEPDPVTPLCQQLTQALRAALQEAHRAHAQLHKSEMERLTNTKEWGQISDEQRAHILNKHGISGIPEIQVSTEAELLTSLGRISLEEWATRQDALLKRFANALEEAAKLLEPRAVRVTLPSATLKDEDDLKAWLGKAEDLVSAQLKKGPVIL